MARMTVTFPGGKRVDAEYGGLTVRTDQPRPSHTYSSRPATCAGPTVTSTVSASASGTPLAAKAGITCAHSAAWAKA